jgi:hypothetical protein
MKFFMDFSMELHGKFHGIHGIPLNFMEHLTKFFHKIFSMKFHEFFMEFFMEYRGIPWKIFMNSRNDFCQGSRVQVMWLISFSSVQ